jgi:lysine-specific permease
MLSKKLETRHINMIALGGSIGTGIFLASGIAIATGGPGGALLSYFLISIMVFFLMTSLGELATFKPTTGSFNEYSERYVDKSFGYAMGLNYWFNWSLTIASEISAAVILIKFWFPHASDIMLSGGLLFLIVIFNIFSVRIYGEVEYFMSFIKVAAIIVFIILGILIISGTPGHGIQNFHIGDAPFHKGWEGFLGVFLATGFAFQGCEIVGITAGEARDPQTSIPKAIKKVFWRLALFYILAMAIIALLVPYNSPSLMVQNDVKASPFTLVFAHYFHSNLAANILNFVILTAVISAANASVYTSSRTLWYMAHRKQVPQIFDKITKSGIPISAVIASLAFGSIVLVTSFVKSGELFNFLVNIVSASGFISWFGISLSHYMFRKKIIKGNTKQLIYKALWFPFGPIFSMILVAIITIGQFYTFDGVYSFQNLSSAYGALFLFTMAFLYHKLWRSKKYPMPEEFASDQ